jgi:signal recognition particle subunit SEC65
MTLPKFLYKYTRRKYAEDMINFGSIFINTLNNLRNEDIYGLEIGDQSEGTQTTHMRGKVMDLTNPSTIAPTIKRMQREKRLIGNGQIIIGESVNEMVNDAYIYSLSTNNNLINQFGEDTVGYDAILEIFDPPRFFKQLLKCIHKYDSGIKEVHYNNIEYFAREQEFENQTEAHPIFIKDPKHRWQEEFRLACDCNGKEIQPIKLQCNKLRNYIRIFND